MSSNQNNATWTKQTTLGLVLLLAIIAFLAWLLTLILPVLVTALGVMQDRLTHLDSTIIVALITGTISIVTVIGGTIVKARMEFTRRNREALREKRIEPYAQLVAIFYKVQAATVSGEPYTQEQMVADVLRFSQTLTLWGSPKAIQEWGRWRVSFGKDDSPSGTEVLFAMERILFQLRKDLGVESGLKRGDLLRLFANDIDEYL